MNPIMCITLNNQKQIKIELYPDIAPNTVNSMITLIQQGLLDHRPIQRIAYDFVLQFTYNGFNHDPKCEYIIDGEFDENGHANPIAFEKGVVGMGGDGSSIASGCDFFIVIGDQCQERLNGKFTAFGKVISGYEEVDRIIQVPTKKIIRADNPNVDINEPLVPEIMEKVTVETFGIEYPKPHILRYGES